MGMWGTSLEENDMFLDVRGDYHDLVEGGLSRSEATKQLCEEYEEQMEDEDDAVFVWAALADAQMEDGPILKSTQRKALEALDCELARRAAEPAGEQDPSVLAEYIENLKSFRARVEAGKAKPKERKKPVKCPWKVGDVYALRLVSPKAEELGLAGHYLLLRMAEVFVSCHESYPHVYLSITEDTKLPETEAEVAKARYLQSSFRKTFRISLIAIKQEEFETTPFQYIGCFPALPAPLGEYIMPNEMLGLWGVSTLLRFLEECACKGYEFYIIKGGQP